MAQQFSTRGIGFASTNVPTNLQVIQQAETGPTVTSYGSGVITGASPNQNMIGWKSVANANSYNIYRANNGGSYSLYANITASASATQYSSYVTGQGSFQVAPGIDSVYLDTASTAIIGTTLGAILNVTGNVTSGSNVLNVTAVTSGTVTIGQGIGGPGIPIGATISSFGSGGGGTGTYNMSLNASSNQTAQTYGTVYFGDQGYTYYVTAVVSGVESSASALAILPFIVNGQPIMCAGVFNNPANNFVPYQVAPATTPLGYANACGFNSNATQNYINTYSGYNPNPSNFQGGGCAGYNLSTTGYSYINFAIYCPTAGLSLQSSSEIAGDGLLVNSSLSTWGAATLPQNTWYTYKIPLGGSNGIYIDALLGSTNVPQTAFYKITWQFTTVPTVNTFIEVWFTVN